MPGCVMAMARLDRPSVFVYGGTIRPGPKHRDIISVFEAVGSYAAGKIDDAELKEVESTAIPGPGSCAGMYTANTMASAIEALGLSLANSSAQEAVSSAKRGDCRRAGEAVVALLERGIKPSDILSKEAFENAITTVIALGGSTNAVLHLLAIAHDARVDLALDDFTRIGDRTPVLADLRPSGRYLMSELVRIGGIQPLQKTLLDAGLLHGGCLTVTGRTVAENLASVAAVPGRPGHRPAARRPDQARQPSRGALRQPRARGRRGEDLRQGRPALRGTGPRVPLRGASAARDSRRRRRRGRRGRDPLRRPEGRARHARDAEPDRRHHRPRARRATSR